MNIGKYPDWFSFNKKRLYGNFSDSQWNDYKWQLSNRLNRICEIQKMFPKIKFGRSKELEARLKFSITPYTACLIEPEKKDDPVAKQFVPSSGELIGSSDLVIDPFNEKKRSPVKNIIKRYPDRAVLIATNNCAGYCRYCTRKRIWDEPCTINDELIESTRKYLLKNRKIREIIISGGEPFLLAEGSIDKILSMLFSIKHIEVVRIGTRILTFLPQRIDKKILKILSKYKPLWIMTHINHPQEITDDTERAIDGLLNAGAVLANQSVLLKGINDNFETIKNLNHILQRLRIYPYYLFQCDLVSGTEHLRASIDDGVKIMKKLRGNTGGITIPSYIIDIPDGGKIPVLPEYIVKTTRQKMILKNYQDRLIEYPNTKKPYLKKIIPQ